jgi:hypothetical protein
LKPFAVIRTDYPESTDLWEFDDEDEAKTFYDEMKNYIRKGNSIMLVKVLDSKDS